VLAGLVGDLLELRVDLLGLDGDLLLPRELPMSRAARTFFSARSRISSSEPKSNEPPAICIRKASSCRIACSCWPTSDGGTGTGLFSTSASTIRSRRVDFARSAAAFSSFSRVAAFSSSSVSYSPWSLANSSSSSGRSFSRSSVIVTLKSARLFLSSGLGLSSS